MQKTTTVFHINNIEVKKKSTLITLPQIQKDSVALIQILQKYVRNKYNSKILLFSSREY